MSSFTMLLLEEGVDVELPVDLSGIVGILDEEVRNFTHDGYGYALSPGKGPSAIGGISWSSISTTTTRKYFRHRWDGSSCRS